LDGKGRLGETKKAVREIKGEKHSKERGIGKRNFLE
jgi:hypothetical protein